MNKSLVIILSMVLVYLAIAEKQDELYEGVTVTTQVPPHNASNADNATLVEKVKEKAEDLKNLYSRLISFLSDIKEDSNNSNEDDHKTQDVL